MHSYSQYPILSAQAFIKQGTTAGAIMSIAESNPAHAKRLRAVAREVASITGQSLQIPGAVTEARRSANDNRRRQNRRAA